MQVSKIGIFLLLITIVACGKKKLPPEEYVGWVRDYKNGLHRQKEVGNFIFDVQYKPHDYLILNEDKSLFLDKGKYNKRLSELSDFEYYSLKISNNAGDFTKGFSTNPQEVNAKQYYYSFNFKDDIYLQVGDEKVPCTLYHYERSYDLSSAKTFVLGFRKTDKKDSDISFVVDSREIGLGPIKILFEHSDLLEIPQIKF